MTIIVYSQANCPGCSAVKMTLSSKGIDYQEVRIDQDAEAKAFVIGNGHRSVPVVYKDGVHVPNPLSLCKEKE
jgi:glutaredoxin